MTLNQIAREWDEITGIMRGEKRRIEDREARTQVEKLIAYCRKRTCGACAIRTECRKGDK